VRRLAGCVDMWVRWRGEGGDSAPVKTAGGSPRSDIASLEVCTPAQPPSPDVSSRLTCA
jgi:hypothetical protein